MEIVPYPAAFHDSMGRRFFYEATYKMMEHPCLNAARGAFGMLLNQYFPHGLRALTKIPSQEVHPFGGAMAHPCSGCLVRGNGNAGM